MNLATILLIHLSRIMNSTHLSLLKLALKLYWLFHYYNSSFLYRMFSNTFTLDLFTIFINHGDLQYLQEAVRPYKVCQWAVSIYLINCLSNLSHAAAFKTNKSKRTSKVNEIFLSSLFIIRLFQCFFNGCIVLHHFGHFFQQFLLQTIYLALILTS